MAANKRRRWRASIMGTFVAGVQRAITTGRVSRASISCSDKASNSVAVMTGVNIVGFGTTGSRMATWVAIEIVAAL